MDLFIFSEGDPSLYEANYRSLKHIIETALDSRKVCKAEPCTNNGIVQCEALITRSCMGFLLIISIFYLSPIRSSKVCRITPDKGLWALCCIFVWRNLREKGKATLSQHLGLLYCVSWTSWIIVNEVIRSSKEKISFGQLQYVVCVVLVEVPAIAERVRWFTVNNWYAPE